MTPLSFGYSPELIQRVISVFKEEDGFVLSEEEAVAVLESFAGLYLAFSMDISSVVASAPRKTSADLIDPHNC